MAGHVAGFFKETPEHQIWIKMGKGDRRTRRGKIVNKSYGKTRPRKTKKASKPKSA